MPAPCGETLEDLVRDLVAIGRVPEGKRGAVLELLEPWRERLELALEGFDVDVHWSWEDYRREIERRIAWWFGPCWSVGRREECPT